MKNPTQQELIDFIDGILPPHRHGEVERIVSSSPQLQKEVAMFRAIHRTIGQGVLDSPSHKFTSNVLNELLPVKKESMWFRIIKNSSNIFAMLLVLSIIGIAIIVGPSENQRDASLLTRSLESYSVAYNGALQNFSNLSNQFMQPVNHAANTTSGKFFLLGLVIFIIFIVVDDTIGKRYFHTSFKL